MSTSPTEVPSILGSLPPKRELVRLMKRKGVASERDAAITTTTISHVNMSTSPTEVPASLGSLPQKRELVRLLKRKGVASERDAAITTTSHVNKKSNTTGKEVVSAASSAVKAVSPSTCTLSVPPSLPSASSNNNKKFDYEEFLDIANIRTRIQNGAFASIKKTVHTEQNKPHTEFKDCIQNEKAVVLLLQGFQPKSNSKTMIKWVLDEGQVLDWLNIRDDPCISPVKSRIKCYLPIDENKPLITAHAGIESVEIKWQKKSGSISFKFCTYLVWYG